MVILPTDDASRLLCKCFAAILAVRDSGDGKDRTGYAVYWFGLQIL
jgi:hypothetical protein